MSTNTQISITNTGIIAVAYRRTARGTKVLKCRSCAFESAAVLNGVLVDADEVLGKLRLLKNQDASLFKNASLLVDSNEISVKRMEMPKLTDAQCQRFVEHDFSAKAGENTDLICGYSRLNKTGTQLLGGAAVTSLVERFAALFDKVGVQLQDIHIGIEAVIRYMETHLPQNGETTVLNMADGPTMLSLLFDNGRFVFVTRTRILADSAEEYGDYLLRELSSVTQFSTSQNMSPITKSYYLGVPETVLNSISGRTRDVRVLEYVFEAPLTGVPIHPADMALTTFAMLDCPVKSDYTAATGK